MQCGIFNRELSHIGERRYEMLDVTMRQIADTLGAQLPLSVVDQTGLAGHYDAVLDVGPGCVFFLRMPSALPTRLGPAGPGCA